jgi:hypothetical protein
MDPKEIDLGTVQAGSTIEFSFNTNGLNVISYSASCLCTVLYLNNDCLKGHITIYRPSFKKEVSIKVTTLDQNNSIKFWDLKIKIKTK